MVYTSLDAYPPGSLDKADVILILYGMLGVRPSKPGWGGELEEQAILQCENVIWVGVQYSVQTNTLLNDLMFEDPTTGFKIGSSDAEPYNFRIVADPKDKKVQILAPQNKYNISKVQEQIGNSPWKRFIAYDANYAKPTACRSNTTNGHASNPATASSNRTSNTGRSYFACTNC